MPSVPAAAPISFYTPLTILKTPWVGVECLLHLHLPSCCLLKTSAKSSGILTLFLVWFLISCYSPNLLSLSAFLPCTNMYPFQKQRGLMSCVVIAVIFLAPWFFSFSPVVNTWTAQCFSLAKSRACSGELPLGPAHPPLSYCSAMMPQDSSPSCCFPGSSSFPTASAHPRGGCPSPCPYGPWTNPAEFLP